MHSRCRRWVGLATLPVLVLAACSGKGAAPGTSPTDTLQTSASSTVAGSSGAGGDTSGSASGSSSAGGTAWDAGTDSLTVGLIGPFTGPFAVLGISQQNSLQVVADQINQSGGIGGAQVKIVTRDIGLDPGKGVQAATELSGDASVKLIVGPSITSFYEAASGTYEQKKVVNCQPAVAAGDFAGLKYGYRSQDSLTQDVERILSYLKSQNVTTIGEIYEGDDTGKAVRDLLTQLGPKYGVTVTGYETTNTDDQSHLSYVQKLADSGAIWISSNSSGAKTMAAAAEAGYKGVLVGGSGIQNIAFIEAAGKAAAGTVFAAPNYQWPIQDRSTWQPGYREHIEAVVDKYGTNVGPKTGATSPKGTAIAADCLYAYAAAADAGQSLDSDKVVAAMDQLDIAADKTPSGCEIKPVDHGYYPQSCVRAYKWQVDDKGWFTTDVTPSE